jgi:hypothetical protein
MRVLVTLTFGGEIIQAQIKARTGQQARRSLYRHYASLRDCPFKSSQKLMGKLPKYLVIRTKLR